MASGAPLSVLLSQVLVAFTIELDNEFESQVAKTWARPNGVSLVMWSNYMRFVREDGTPIRELVERSRLPKESVVSITGGMERWRYVTVDWSGTGAPPQRKGFGSGRGVKSDTLIRPSMTGELAQRLWGPLPLEVQQRWESRLGEGLVADLRAALAAVLDDIDLVMPHFLPVVGGGGMFAHAELEAGTSEPDPDLSALLSRVLLAYTIEHEDAADVSLPIGSNVLRVLGTDRVRVRDIPLATGVSKEAVAMSMTWLDSAGHITVEPDPSGRGKVVRITASGVQAQGAHARRLAEAEGAWETRFGKARIDALRRALEAILNQPGGEDGPLSAGSVPPPGAWRGKGRYKPLTDAFVADPAGALPYYPMVLHRGGWPDGS